MFTERLELPARWEGDPARDRYTGEVGWRKRGAPADLRREVERSAALRDHPSFRRVLDFDGEELVLEWLPGETPATLTRAQVISLLRALVRLHGEGFAHGDLKADNLLVSGDHVALIDLAFSSRLGTRPPGGSPAFLAPELVAGEACSVASDLYALGAMLDALGVEPELAAACVREDPALRPASAGSCLALLDSGARPIDRAVHRAARPTLPPVVVAGSIETTAVDALLTERLRDGLLTARFWFRHGFDPLAAFCVDGTGPLSERAVAAAIALARAGIPVVVHGSAAADEDAREALHAWTKVASSEGATFWVLDADEALVSRLREAGGEAIAATCWSEERVEEELHRWGVPSGVAAALRERTGGEPQATLAAIRELAGDPAAHLADLFEEEEEDLAPLDAARRALALGAGGRALRHLAQLGDAPSELVADAHAMRGQLEEALAAEPAPVAHDRRLLRAERLARSGRFDEADEAAIQLGDHPVALYIRALVARERGDMGSARAFATRTAGMEPATHRIEAMLLEADVATQLGDLEDALRLAQRAHAEAELPRQRSAAHARYATALMLSGRGREAVPYFVGALEEAEAAGDLLTFPTHIMNLATAHHSMGELGAAIREYERALQLAETLERPVTVAAACVNLAALYVSLGLDRDAQPLLERARRVTEELGYALYRAQCSLVEAERLARSEPQRAFDRAAAARDEFLTIEARRQAAEAELLMAEIALALPSVQPPILDEQALDRAGLSARLHAHRARRAFRDGALDAARALVGRALTAAGSDSDAVGRVAILELAVEIEAVTGVATGVAEELVATRRAVADSLPAGIREHYRPREPTPSVTRGIGEGGRRLVALARRLLLERDERRVLSAALDEAVVVTGAERAFLLRAGEETRVVVARNLDREHIRGRDKFSRTIAERVLATGESVLAARADDDPELAQARSVRDMGLRSVLCVPVPSPDGVVAAIYLDHRFHEGTFAGAEREWVGALADLLGLALENTRLHAEAARHAEELERRESAARHASEARAREVARLADELRRRGAPPTTGGIVATGDAMRRAVDLATRVASSDLSVLVLGESGTGKELFARLVHDRSLRNRGPMLTINCGALAPSLLESELFGHVRGAFTGASADQPGLFRSAHGGTLFLDEVGEMPLEMQTRLLRVLQDGRVRPVGGAESVATDVRIVAATNRDLSKAIREGSFRQDLYFRLAGVEIVLPPLRERRDEIPALVDTLLQRIAQEPGMSQRAIGEEALRALFAYDWPGNVRELQQVLRRAVLLSQSETLQPADLFEAAPVRGSRARAVARFDRELLVQALRVAKGNKSQAARALDISRVTLYRWLSKYGIADADWRS